MSLLTAKEVMDQQRYSEDEEPFIETLILGAEAFLKNADAYRPENDLTKVVMSVIVGFWLEHREAQYSNYRRVGDFPLTIGALINQLKYLPEEKEDMTPEIASLMRGVPNG